jgi:soluble cytochrome b562
MELTSDNLDNILIRQKDKIIDLIDSGKTKEAQAALRVVEELWAACNYDYKTKELRERIKHKTTRAKQE